ncbi:MAG: hypothetical protein ACREYE_09465 [Gammaproteobacteria bacterium]
MKASIKPGASLGLRSRFINPGYIWAIGFPIIVAAYNDLEYECVLTEGCGGTHSTRSRHYDGLALDLRTNHMKADHRVELAMNLTTALGPEFQVILETDHLHVEYDPKP